jgi:hypothetical protein
MENSIAGDVNYEFIKNARDSGGQLVIHDNNIIYGGSSYHTHEFVAKKLADNGFQISKKLGKGTMGVAFLLTNGTVLKITEDISEAKAASLIEGKQLKHVYEVYRVFMFKKIPSVYFINCELLRPNDHKQYNDSAFYKGTNDIDTENVEEIFDPIQFSKYLGYFHLDPEKYIGDGKLHTPYDLLTKYQQDIADGLMELRDFEITYADVHAGNIMRRKNGDYVFIDLGYSQSGEGNIKILERYYKKFKEN